MLSVLFIHTLLALTSCTEFNDKVFRSLLHLCPQQNVPDDNNDTDLNQTTRPGGCCLDLFNSSSQQMIGINKTRQRTDSQRCLYPLSHQERAPTDRAYYMITNAPEDGCALPDEIAEHIPDDFDEATCNDSEVTPLRRFLPVYSKSSGLIYKNIQCAYCHGQYQLKIWQARAHCPSSWSPFPDDLALCEIQFVYTGHVDDIQHLECFTDNFSKCPVGYAEDVIIPPGIDLSMNELAEACSMDGLPRFRYLMYSKNVFCHICHYCNYNDKCVLTPNCIPLMRTDNFLSRSSTNFIRILDSRVINQDHPQDNTICGLDTDKQVCHEVLCPLGQLMVHVGDEMKCQMDSLHWTSTRNKFVVWLLLEFDTSIAVADDVLARWFAESHVNNPWHDSWTIEAIYRPFASYVDKIDANLENNISNTHLVTSLTHAYVRLSFKRQSANPGSLMMAIQEILPEMWHLQTDNTTYKAKQKFGRYTFRTILARINETDKRLLHVPSWHLSPYFNIKERFLYTSVNNGIIKHFRFVLTKLVFCRQVELALTNFNVFRVESYIVALYYNRTGAFLYDNDFVRGRLTNDVPKVRICLSDTEMRPHSNKLGIGQGFHPLLVIISIFLEVFVLM